MFKKSYVVIPVRDSKHVLDDGSPPSPIPSYHAHFLSTISDAFTDAQAHVLNGAPGTASVILETLYYIEAPPVSELSVSEWNEHDELVPVHLDDESV